MNKFLRREINTVFVMLGAACNFQCKYCMQHPLIHDQVTAKINPDTIEFLKEVAVNQERKLRIQFYGGEPLLYWDNIVTITEALKDNCVFSTITNGGLLTMDKVDFFNKHDFNIAVSWDGLNVKQTRGKDVFEDNKIKECLFNLNNANISAVMSAYNYPLSILEYVDKLNQEYYMYRKEHGLSERILGVNMDEIMDTGLEDKSLVSIDYQRVYNEMTILCEHYKEQINGESDYNPYFARFINNYVGTLINRVNNDPKFSMCRCGNGYNVLNLDLDGNLYRCHNTHIKVGTIYDNYFKYLENVIHYDGTKEFNKKCSECYVQDICFNGCPLISQEMRDKYYCDMKRAAFYPVIEMVMELGKE